MLTSDLEIVAALAEAIALRISPERYRLWFHDRTRFAWEEGELRIGVGNRFQLEWLEKRFAQDIAAAAAEVFGRPVTVRFVIDGELFRATRTEQTDPPAQPAKPAKAAEPAPATPRAQPTRTRRWHQLSSFIVGACNRVAHASALSTIEQPGQDGNPLVLHGPVGTGKTHLLEGVYSGLRKRYADWNIVCISAEDFTNRFVQAMRTDKLGAFRRHFRQCDALLLDDLHFLATKRATQEEFLHTFDVLQGDSRQIVVTCDCHPRLNEQLLPELVDRLLGGAVWSLQPPDYETRMLLLQARAQHNRQQLPKDVLLFLAETLRGNVRELEGALNSLWHYSRVAGRKIDMALTREALGDLLRHSIRVVQLTDIEQALCQVLRMDAGALQGQQRTWAYSHPRMLAMYLARKHTAATYADIGRYFGKRTHSTVVASEKKVRLWLQKDEELSLGKVKVRVREVLERTERELQR